MSNFSGLLKSAVGGATDDSEQIQLGWKLRIPRP